MITVSHPRFYKSSFAVNWLLFHAEPVIVAFGRREDVLGVVPVLALVLADVDLHATPRAEESAFVGHLLRIERARQQRLGVIALTLDTGQAALDPRHTAFIEDGVVVELATGELATLNLEHPRPHRVVGLLAVAKRQRVDGARVGTPRKDGKVALLGGIRQINDEATTGFLAHLSGAETFFFEAVFIGDLCCTFCHNILRHYCCTRKAEPLSPDLGRRLYALGLLFCRLQ